MQLSKALSFDVRAIRLRVALLYPIALLRTAWIRRDPGLRGVLLFPLGFLKCLLGVAIGFWFCGHRMWFILSMHAYMRWVDDLIDGDYRLPRGMTLESYLRQKDHLFAALPESHSCELRLEDIFLISLIREGRHYGFDFVPNFQRMWQWYQADVDRQLRKELPISLDELDCPAMKANVEFLVVFFGFMGGDPIGNQWLLGEALTLLMSCDVLYDLLRDIHKGITWLPSASLDRYGVSLPLLQNCQTWEDLACVPGFIEWYHYETRRTRTRWDKLKDVLPQAMCPLLPHHQVRTLFIRAVVKQFDFYVSGCESRAQSLAIPC